ncbi:hypothetical protein AB0A94_13460 [Streptomyces sp. NPDC044984]
MTITAQGENLEQRVAGTGVDAEAPPAGEMAGTTDKALRQS